MCAWRDGGRKYQFSLLNKQEFGNSDTALSIRAVLSCVVSVALVLFCSSRNSSFLNL